MNAHVLAIHYIFMIYYQTSMHAHKTEALSLLASKWFRKERSGGSSGASQVHDGCINGVQECDG
jgi:hypothetical protein